MLVPLYGHLNGNTPGVLILVQGNDRISDVAAILLEALTIQLAANLFVEVYFHERLLNPDITVIQAGITALDRIDVILK